MWVAGRTVLKAWTFAWSFGGQRNISACHSLCQPEPTCLSTGSALKTPHCPFLNCSPSPLAPHSSQSLEASAFNMLINILDLMARRCHKDQWGQQGPGYSEWILLWILVCLHQNLDSKTLYMWCNYTLHQQPCTLWQVLALLAVKICPFYLITCL